MVAHLVAHHHVLARGAARGRRHGAARGALEPAQSAATPGIFGRVQLMSVTTEGVLACCQGASLGVRAGKAREVLCAPIAIRPNRILRHCETFLTLGENSQPALKSERGDSGKILFQALSRWTQKDGGCVYCPMPQPVCSPDRMPYPPPTWFAGVKRRCIFYHCVVYPG